MPALVCPSCQRAIPTTVTQCPACGVVIQQASKEKFLGFLDKPSRRDLIVWGSLGTVGTIGIIAMAFSGRSSSPLVPPDSPGASIQSSKPSPGEVWGKLPARSHVEAARQLVTQWGAQQQRLAKFVAGTIGKNEKALSGKQILPKDVQDIRSRLALVGSGQAEYGEAQALLKQIDEIQNLADANEKKTQSMAEAMVRVTFAETLQNRFLDQRMNAEVKASGKDSTVLTIRYVLATDVMARDLQKSGILDKAWECGFQTVKLAGTDYVWDWKVKPRTDR